MFFFVQNAREKLKYEMGQNDVARSVSDVVTSGSIIF